MLERELQQAVIECAQLLGWRVAHFRAAQTAQGWRTPVQADGAGFPDLVLVRASDARLIFAELKTGRGSIRPEQAAWLADLDEVAEQTEIRGTDERFVSVHVWRPDDWLTGRIEQVLR